MLTQEQIQKLREAGYDDIKIGAFARRQDLMKPEVTQNREDSVGFFQEPIQDIAQTGRGIADVARKTYGQATELANARGRGEETWGSSLLKGAGIGLGGASDVIGEVIKGVGKVALTRGGEERTKNIMGAVAKPVVESKPIQDLANWYQNLGDQDRRTVDALAGGAKFGVDLLAFGAAKKGVGVVGREGEKLSQATGQKLIRTGESLEKSAATTAETQNKSFIRTLVRPEQTKKVKEAQVGRTTEAGRGIFKRSVVEPSSQELGAEVAISKIPGISPKNTFQKNFNIISEANKTEAETLIKTLEKNDFIFPKQELKARLNELSTKLTENPSLVGSNELTAQKLMAGFNKLLDSSEAKGSSLLKLRKDYDAWVRSQKGSKIFDPASENAFSVVNREIRQTVNSFLDEKAVSVEVKQSLSKQSALFRALDNIQVKAAKEADTAIGRAFQRASDIVGTKNKAVQIIGASVGLAGFGAAAAFAPAAAITGASGFLVYQAGKLILKPELRAAFGRLLKEVGGKMAPADRRVLQNAIKGSDITEGLIKK